ncbi:hypothetical protein B5V88_13220 [Heyndrickxia sporothermodurans]|uniref:Uncharacterized protein n=1 Tax=Heyndrickxia sporothermodurans TaxID=46224 RepID=A0A150KLN2_9BACI|nr:hypothetical protein B4102_3635 [Heyndrickxia sporothermodurans]MBL5866913.1 hypothetical protein [Heyndrickxia sporothermodurans]PTY76033.1 hypothetical protein B5V88_13220 [Heyndrickxia sporothermodurans]PTY79498.1 hypothetical protein B5V89_05960 [Heyndrickxia sporothermodurans]PTY85528.1 hypothetical protein B5V91_09450 [Heyndrickxia sporothermodurans]
MLLFVVFIVLLSSITIFSYEESKKFKGFPVPKHAKLTKSRADFEAYDWSPASEEEGLPLRYLLIIKLKGWKKTFEEGSLTIYEKDGYKIDVISQTDYLSLGIDSDSKNDNKE